jgi:hypothetical protein
MAAIKPLALRESDRHRLPRACNDDCPRNGTKLGRPEVVIGTIRYRDNDSLTRLANGNSISAR